jgi:segregation and condensation protein B
VTSTKNEPSDTTPPASGVDEAARAAHEEAPGAPVEDIPTVNLTGEDLAGLGEALAAVHEEARTEDEAAGVEQARELSRSHLKGLLEALIFASDKPLKSGEVARLASAPVKQVRELLKELEAAYAGRGIVLSEIAGGWLFRTSVEYAPFVREMASEKPVRLTRAQVETLAIAAYRQPITRPEIDDIRGVDSGATLKLLLERDLLRILGKKDEPGRPLLYGTTTQFLEFFGLKSLKDLPTLKEFTELSDESRRVAEAELGDVLPEHAKSAATQAGAGAGAGAGVPEGAPESSGEPSDTITPPAEHDTIQPPPPSRDELDDTQKG